eukprot:m.36809 g.36809  ORF g.36809 m.36809 type:complete len:292 (+) comp14530_c0_seq16:79-954(+)
MAMKRLPEDPLQPPAMSRMRHGSSTPPSKVLHFRNLPPGISEQEIGTTISPYGPVEKIVLTPSNQALVKCAKQDTATAVIQAAQYLFLRGQPITVQYSTHQDLGPNATGGGAETGYQGAVLLLKVTNQAYPVDLNTVKLILSKYGTVLRIATFVKSGVYQALCEMSSRQEAANALQNLHMQYIYEGCCQVSVEFSAIPRVVIKMDSPTHRDFTRPPNAPVGPMGGGAHPMHGRGPMGPPGFMPGGGAYVPMLCTARTGCYSLHVCVGPGAHGHREGEAMHVTLCVWGCRYV